MSTFIPIPDVVQVTFRYTHNTRKFQQVMYFLWNDGHPDIGRMNSLGGALRNWFFTEVRSLLTSRLSLTTIDMWDCSSRHGLFLRYLIGLPVAGTSGQLTHAPEIALVVQWRGVDKRRDAKGRQFVPGMTSASTTFGEPGTAYSANVQIAFNRLLTNYNTGFCDLCVVSRYLNNAVRMTPKVTLVADAVVRPHLSALRSRKY